jgi:sugar O-acyltransferase (sialic acid O-acetyltransferase NeuD family)
VSARALVIVGGGEHARVVADAIATRPERWQLAGFTSADPISISSGPPAKYLGDDAALARMLMSMPHDERPALVLGFGGPPDARRAAVRRFGVDITWAVVVHAGAWVAATAVLEPGAVILAAAVVNDAARVGPHGIVNSGAIVEHDVVVGAGTHIAPGAAVGGGTTIGIDVVIGLGAAVRDHLSIGDRAVVGMGAVVVDDVAADTTVMGVPARVRGTERA